MQRFDKRYQENQNGPLTKNLRDRIRRFKDDGATLKEIGDALGFSGAFISKLINKDAPANISSKHIPRVVKTLEEQERRAGYLPSPIAGEARDQRESTAEDFPLEELVRAISAKGFRVTLSSKEE